MGQGAGFKKNNCSTILGFAKIITSIIFIRWARGAFNTQEEKKLESFLRRHTTVLFSENGYVLLHLGDCRSESADAKVNNGCDSGMWHKSQVDLGIRSVVTS